MDFTAVLNAELEFFLARIFSCAPFLACVGYLLGTILFISTFLPIPHLSKNITINFNSVVALAGFFGFAFALLDVPQSHNQAGGKQGTHLPNDISQEQASKQTTQSLKSTAVLAQGVVRTSGTRTPFPVLPMLITLSLHKCLWFLLDLGPRYPTMSCNNVLQ